MSEITKEALIEMGFTYVHSEFYWYGESPCIWINTRRPKFSFIDPSSNDDAYPIPIHNLKTIEQVKTLLEILFP